MIKLKFLLKTFIILLIFESTTVQSQNYQIVDCNDPLPPSGWERTRHLFYCPDSYPDYTIIMMHRGLWTKSPENSLGAMREAIRFRNTGVNTPGYVELDIQKGINGTMYLFHDFFLDRLTTGTGRVYDSNKKAYMTYNEIKNYSLVREGKTFSGEHIPTLSEVLDIIKPSSLLVNLDKVESFLPQAIDLVIEKEMEERVITKGVWRNHKTPNDLRAFLGTYAHIDLILKIYTPIIYENNIDEVTKDIIDQWLAIDGFPGFQINYKTYNSRVFTENKFDGKNLIEYLKSKNVRVGIFSDKPDNCQGTWATATRSYNNNAATDADRRGEWEYIYEHGANFIITDGAPPLLSFLKIAGKRNTIKIN